MMKIRTIPIAAIPFIGIHLACFLVFLPAVWHSTTLGTIVLAFSLFVLRMFGLTGGYHRYFSHRTYRTSRWFQFVLAWIGCSAAQKGPLWWSSHHRHHHNHSDQPEDVHSPTRDGVWWSHVGWVLSPQFDDRRDELIHDLTKYPELRWLDKYHLVPFFVLAGLCFLFNGWAGLLWGAVVSTVVLYHAVFCINSFCHIIGRRRFATTDDSKNSLILALVTLGEGWHNNHHYFQGSVNQGFYWWEIDITYYILKVLSWCGLVWNLKKPPRRILELGRQMDRQRKLAAAGEPVAV